MGEGKPNISQNHRLEAKNPLLEGTKSHYKRMFVLGGVERVELDNLISHIVCDGRKDVCWCCAQVRLLETGTVRERLGNGQQRRIWQSADPRPHALARDCIELFQSL